MRNLLFAIGVGAIIFSVAAFLVDYYFEEPISQFAEPLESSLMIIAGALSLIAGVLIITSKIELKIKYGY